MSGGREALLIVALAATTCGLRAAGPTLLGSRPLPPRLTQLLELIGPALLSGLIVWQVFSHGKHLVADARVVGLVVAGIGALARLPIPVVLIAAAVATALTRVV